MASCEKCWMEATELMKSHPTKTRSEIYYELLESRKDSPCTPEEQAGLNATECNHCKRMTVHQYSHHCVICHKEQI